MSLTKEQRIKQIIKYNTSRKYFGGWTPYDLNKSYVSTEPISIYIGNLSTDIICDAIWNEMSYNPKRFGNSSPFMFDNKNSLTFFITKEISQDDKACHILSKIKSYLSNFYNMAIKYDDTFKTTNRFKKSYITITNTQPLPPDSKPQPCFNYKMLGCLRTCIHIIASQNIQDFNKKSYREQIINTVINKHPNLTRSNQPIDFAMLRKYKAQESRIKFEIATKNDDISITMSRINDLESLEIPGDTSQEELRLEQQTRELQHLEMRLAAIQRNIQNTKTR